LPRQTSYDSIVIFRFFSIFLQTAVVNVSWRPRQVISQVFMNGHQIKKTRQDTLQQMESPVALILRVEHTHMYKREHACIRIVVVSRVSSEV